MTPAQIAAQIRAWGDFVASWAYWAAALALTALFVSAVAKIFGIRVPGVPTLSETALLYLAGAAYALKR